MNKILQFCQNNNNSQKKKKNKVFNYGVASGDPQQNSVVLWTHAKPIIESEYLEVEYQISSDYNFTNIISNGKILSLKENDFTIKINPDNLRAGFTYYYRFIAENQFSDIGRTLTLPQDTDEVRFAVVSCSNLADGLFNVYKAITEVNKDFNAIIHLGDYIYEYDNQQNQNNLKSLEDYRLRYAKYRSNQDLQLLHSKYPIISIWDDHEFADNTYKDGAGNHHQEIDGDWLIRRENALRSYHEWIPIKTNTNKEKIWRHFKFGNLVNLIMLETRVSGRDKQLNINKLINEDMNEFKKLIDPDRQLLGYEQSYWLENTLNKSNTKWEVLGQPIIMSNMEIPNKLLKILEPLYSTIFENNQKYSRLYNYFNSLLFPLNNNSFEKNEILNQIKIGLNQDSWDGYPQAREKILTTLLNQKKNVVVLSGDTHNCWNYTLRHKGMFNKALKNQQVGVEWATPSVTSPGMDYYTNLPIKYIFEKLIPDLKWCNLDKRGWLEVTFNYDKAIGVWKSVSTVKDKKFIVSELFTDTYKL